ncbi:cyclic nucleotide-gated ion channel 1-like [Prunus avium]|uniref:Cyclic nucleotide-gated ion channel 1-like n=1 Tax=Prunus avium TaxID=42229 RepID=A0A6P5U1M5_PRUAV|nr:cyclic nucleotide-gated ion channel 1-like [Prunus avium]
MAILVFFPTLRASRAVNRMRIMNSLILLQYVPRIYPIYRYCKNLNKKKLDNDISDPLESKTWFPGLLNFILYILASHVFGAFWYFFSIQRLIECWGYACQSGNGCEFRIFYCDDGTTRNVTLLNDLCPINPLNAKVFDFGIYLDALQSGMLGSTDFPQKVLQCFSWGVRNLSSFGSNLKTSMNAWETLFVVFISTSGLLLFIYLLGHLLVGDDALLFIFYICKMATNKEYWIRLKMWKIESDIERMSDEYGLSNASGDIHKIVRRRLRREEDLAVENIFSILPLKVQDIIKRHLFFDKLKTVPTLQDIHQNVLDAILKDLEQAMYDGGNCIIREGEPLDMMIFISRGRVLTYNTTSTGHGGGESGLSNTTGPWLTGGDFYGQELIRWAATSTSFSNWPISNNTLKSHKKVEVFAIRASALLLIVSKYKKYFKTETQSPYPTDYTVIEIN